VKCPARRALPLAAAILALAGCWHGRVLLCAEPPFWASLGEELPVKASLAWQSLRSGWWPEFLLVGPQESPRDRLSAALSARRYGAAVVGPMLSFEAAGFAQGFPRTGFVLVDGPAWAEGAANTVVLSFDRTASYEAAGEATRLSLAAGPAGGLAGVIAVAGGPASDPEVQAFLRGASGSGQAPPVVREIEPPVDSAKVKAAVAEMRGLGVEVFLPRLGVQAVACLEALRDSGGSAVVADWQASGAFAGQVFLSIEEDVIGGIGLCLAGKARPGTVFQGPVRVVCGDARQVPAAAKGKVDCR
jgi:hypothetical protein